MIGLLLILLLIVLYVLPCYYIIQFYKYQKNKNLEKSSSSLSFYLQFRLNPFFLDSKKNDDENTIQLKNKIRYSTYLVLLYTLAFIYFFR